MGVLIVCGLLLLWSPELGAVFLGLLVQSNSYHIQKLQHFVIFALIAVAEKQVPAHYETQTHIMAKLRTNHNKSSTTSGGGMMAKVGIFVVILGGLYWAFNQFSGSGGSMEDAIEQAEVILKGKSSEEQAKEDNKPTDSSDVTGNMLPTSTTGQIVEHDFYTLSYSEQHEQAEWVAYELTKESLIIPNVERTGNFRPDPKVRKASASDRDYRGSGYDRGHMAPAGDMAFSEEAMSQTFYMSNMSPQIRNFNGGIWRELEENVRDWAYQNKHLYVISGPILKGYIRESIGPNKVSVPDKFFKIILDYTEPDIKAIAFLMSNEISYQPLMEYTVSIDEIEEITGIDFFGNLLPDSIEERLETMIEVDDWKVNNKKFELRKDSWNKRR